MKGYFVLSTIDLNVSAWFMAISANLLYRNEMLHLVDHPADLRRVAMHDRLADPGQAKRQHRPLHHEAGLDDAAHLGDVKFLSHYHPP